MRSVSVSKCAFSWVRLQLWMPLQRCRSRVVWFEIRFSILADFSWITKVSGWFVSRPISQFLTSQLHKGLPKLNVSAAKLHRRAAFAAIDPYQFATHQIVYPSSVVCRWTRVCRLQSGKGNQMKILNSAILGVALGCSPAHAKQGFVATQCSSDVARHYDGLSHVRGAVRLFFEEKPSQVSP